MTGSFIERVQNVRRESRAAIHGGNDVFEHVQQRRMERRSIPLGWAYPLAAKQGEVTVANESLEELLIVLETAAKGLTGVTNKRMFGCDGLFANGNIFGLVWKHGRIGVRLPNEIAYAEAMKMPGSSPWIAGTMTMSHWVLVP